MIFKMMVSMKQGFTFSLSVFFLFAMNSVYSQCIPDSSVTELYSPSAAEGLPDGEIGLPYEAVIHFNIPAETTIVITAQIDSVEFTDVLGLPEGIDYFCNPPSCNFPGGSYACIQLAGTPENKNDVGDNDLEVKFTLNTSITDVSDKITDYSIYINDGTPTAVVETSIKSQKLIVNQNPASNRAKLLFDLPNSGPYNLEVYSLLGAKVYSTNSTGKLGHNEMPITDFGLEPGMYFISISMDGYSDSTRFILQ